MKILLTGADGQFGRCLQDCVRDGKGEHELIALNRHGLDITDAPAVSECLRLHHPDVVINGAAYTNVDRAESEPELAYAVNRDGPANLARVCAKLDIPLIHISTDYVFDGIKGTPYTPEDEPNPINVYGKSKLAGEEAIRELCPKHLIIRTSWLFSEYGNNFVKTMLRLAKERDEISVVDDQVGCPTYARDLAGVVLALAGLLRDGAFSQWGTYHFAGDQAVSWYQFAKKVFEVAFVGHGVKIEPIDTTQYMTAATRPKYSVMDSRLLNELLGDEFMNDWLIVLRSFSKIYG